MSDEEIASAIKNKLLLAPKDPLVLTRKKAVDLIGEGIHAISLLQHCVRYERNIITDILSALYQRTEKPFTLERKDIVELAKDYGIKEEELK